MSEPNAPPVLTLLPSGLQCPVAPGQSLLEAALAAGIQMPRSCRNGTCRACLGRIASGSVRYRIEWPGLSPDEKDEGWTLLCVALVDADISLHAPHAQQV
jgi:ferredoxin